jgi:hypothetical protein
LTRSRLDSRDKYEFRENSHRDSIWEIPLNSHRRERDESGQAQAGLLIRRSPCHLELLEPESEPVVIGIIGGTPWPPHQFSGNLH